MKAAIDTAPLVSIEDLKVHFPLAAPSLLSRMRGGRDHARREGR